MSVLVRCKFVIIINKSYLMRHCKYIYYIFTPSDMSFYGIAINIHIYTVTVLYGVNRDHQFTRSLACSCIVIIVWLFVCLLTSYCTLNCDQNTVHMNTSFLHTPNMIRPLVLFVS